MKQKLLNKALSISTLLVMSACGPQAFVPDTVISNQSAAGDMSIPPRVDIVLGMSGRGTMQNIYNSLLPELNAFASKLQSSGWDYRFVSMSLSEHSPAASANISHAVSASHYHSNYPESEWLAPFPGALYTDSQFLMNSNLFTSFLSIPSLDTTYNDGRETGLKNQATFLNRSDVKNTNGGILRSDAMLAVLTISNGRDSSDGWSATDANGQLYSNGPNPIPVNVDNYVNQMRAIKKSPSLAKYYAIVAHNTVNCRAGAAWSGIEYEKAATKMGGISQDICTTPVPTALDAVAAHLQSQKLTFVKRFLVIGTEPNVATIKVFKNGSQELPNSSTNGWTYVGMTTQYTIDSPVPMAQATGYMIELHGSAKLRGSDTARVEYMNAGAQSSH